MSKPASKKKVIGVLMGGFSSERKISLQTGKAVAQALREEGFRVKEIDLRRKNISDILTGKNIYIAFIALHGEYGEDGTIQGLLEMAGIPYTGSGVLASALAMDKVKAKEMFSFHSVATPDWVVLHRGEEGNRVRADKAIKKLGFPLVVKPSQQGSTVGITILRSRSGMSKALSGAFKYSKDVILEKYISGMEITVGILDNTPLPVMEIVPMNSFYDFSAKYKKGISEHVIPARLPDSLRLNAQKTALKAHQVLGCSGATRVDLRVEKKGTRYTGLYVLEVNTIPGMTRISLLPEAALSVGMSFNQLVMEILRLGSK
ncbi:MAG: D-alanine--D-alanine ligase [bacterium]